MIEQVLNVNFLQKSQEGHLVESVTLPTAVRQQLENTFGDGKNVDKELKDELKDLNLEELIWSYIEVTTEELLHAGSLRVLEGQIEDRCDDCSELVEFGLLDDVRYEGWNQNGTWREKPLFIDGMCLGFTSNLLLVEGATRLGILKGLHKNPRFQLNEKHKVWYGSKEAQIK